MKKPRQDVQMRCYRLERSRSSTLSWGTLFGRGPYFDWANYQPLKGAPPGYVLNERHPSVSPSPDYSEQRKPDSVRNLLENRLVSLTRQEISSDVGLVSGGCLPIECATCMAPA